MRSLLQTRRSRAGTALAGVATAVVLIASISGLIGKPPSASPSTSRAATASGSPGSPAPSGQWGSLVLGPDTSTAELTVDAPSRLAVPTTATFQLRSKGAVSASQLATGLKVDPPVAFTLKAGSSADIVSIRPKVALAGGVQYRFRLYAPDGSLAGTWAFRTTGPLHIVDRLPDDRTTGVPVSTGIEVGFDQDSPIDFAAHFSIQPNVGGRFEVHGRTWVFVPTNPLAPATTYTVTVTHGVGLSGSDQVLESTVRWRFETVPTGAGQSREDTIRFDRSIVEYRPGTVADLFADMSIPEDAPDQSPPTSLPVEIYHLSNLAAARSAATTLLSDSGWATWSSIGLVRTSNLTRVASVQASVTTPTNDTGEPISVIHLSIKLDQGWYLAVVPRKGRDAQVLLQVTDLAAYAASTETRTVAWINDLGTVGPIDGTVLTLPSGATLGRSDAAGLVDVATPAELRRSQSPDSVVLPTILTATDPAGRQLLIPLGLGGFGAYASDENAASARNDPANKWWSLFATDRTQYRQSDSVHAWGLVRERAGRAVGTNLTLRLYAQAGSAEAPILRVPIVASARGVFAADLPLKNLPLGEYSIDLYSRAERVATTQFEVAVIRKPAYQITVKTDHFAYIDATPIKVTSSVTFFDGTAAPGLQLRIGGQDDHLGGSTDASGNLVTTLPAQANPDGYTSYSIDATPALPEEGNIGASAQVFVFHSAAWLDATESVTGGRIVVDGTLSALDLAKVEREIVALGYPNDPSGAAAAGRTVSAKVIHEISTRHQSGTQYDFVTKKVVPLYEYTFEEQTIATVSLVTGSDGRFHLSIPAPVAADEYRVDLSARDSAGREIRLQTSATSGTDLMFRQTRPYLEDAGGCGYPTRGVELNDSVNLSFRDANGRVAATGHYLFLVGERGLTDAVLQTSPTLSRAFRDADLPNFMVQAVRFSARGFDVTNTFDVTADPKSKTLSVTLTPSQARYAPGDQVTVAIATKDANGRPVAADVVVRGVDEKLFSIGSASDIDALGILLQPVGAGFLQSYTSHPIPAMPPDSGCGDTGGGRDDFRDFVTFQRISTDAAGHGSVSFSLPDDLTSWHLSATALSGDFDAGSVAVLLPVGLPFFVDAVLAPDYLAGEQAILQVRAFGDALKTGEAVRFTIEAPSLGLAPVTIDGKAFETSRVALPMLTLGDHRITIRGATSDGTRSDSLVRSVHVIATRLTALETSRDSLAAGFTAPGGDGLTTYVITDAGRGALLPLFENLAASSGARFDAAFAADAARELLVTEFDVPDTQLPPADFSLDSYQRDGLALLPYSSTDLFLTARAALVAPDRLNVPDLRNALQEWLADTDHLTRERKVAALAGLAGLGDNVLADLHAIDDGTLTLREQLWLALGYLASGDEDAARTLERSILTASGQRLGPWVRLNAGSNLDDTTAASALLLQLAGGLGDPIAADVSRYLADQPSRQTLFSLEQFGYARSTLERLPRSTARFAWTADGIRHEVALDPGGSFALTLTADQRRSLSLEPLSGSLTVSSSWLAAPAALPSDASISISRVVSPAGDAPADQIVHVRLNVTFGASLPEGCYQVTDLVPSGLAPLATLEGWPQDQDPDAVILVAPYDIAGQKASWCIDPAEKRSFALGYSARVVSPGTYRWEPAIVQSVTAPTLGSATAVETYTIR